MCRHSVAKEKLKWCALQVQFRPEALCVAASKRSGSKPQAPSRRPWSSARRSAARTAPAMCRTGHPPRAPTRGIENLCWGLCSEPFCSE